MTDLNGTVQLTELLALKPYVSKSGTRKVTKTRRVGGGGGRNHEDPAFIDYTVDEPYTFQQAAVATNSRLIAVQDLVFHKESTTTLPESALLTRKEIRNLADASVSSSVNLSLSGTSSWSVTKTTGLSTTTGATVGLQVAIDDVGSGSISVSWSQTISTSTQVSESHSQTVTRSTVDNVSIGPRHSVRIELLAYQSTVEIPFSATIVIDGDIDANLSGVTAASQLLSVAERSFAFSGVLRITDVSDSFLKVEDLGISPATTEPADAILQTDYSSSFSVEGSKEYLSRFKTHKKLQRVGAELLVTAPQLDGEIGQPDGISYEIISTSQVYKPTVACGFNDLGIMNGGIFRVEIRQYRNYANGVLVAQWPETVETFESCWVV